ncbi:MAG: UDP-N-acetylmuramoyl-L-alanine--D-glutamate ligase [Lachnospiraceae bacterium]|nr:UDP-N-acetylmuramoyl-L-alanine--D-glutamate ligase [Lachnospiraceae bacterium]
MLDKKVLVAGCGKSGICATELLINKGQEVILFDENKKNNLTEAKVRENLKAVGKSDKLKIILGQLTEDILEQISVMVISPGIPTDLPFVMSVREKHIPVWSEIELAYYYEKGTVVAITGTNGKTTTTSLVGEIMKAHNPKSFVVGNIGIPYTQQVVKTDEDSVTVAEVSSFQLETIIDFKPHVSAILNITPDHLDRHYTFENYATCKADVSKNQNNEDYVVVNYDDPETMKLVDKLPGNVVYFSRLQELDKGVFVKDGAIVIFDGNFEIKVLDLSDIKILGNHNVENVLAAVAVTYYMGVPVETIEAVSTSFMGVPHRIEYVKTVNGVEYYNDSKGTNPDAAIKGIQAMKSATYLIGGGYDKKSSYIEWIDSFEGKVKKLVLLGETAKDINDAAKSRGFVDTVFVESLEEAVKYCHQHAEDGECVLLSPACASWGMFDNYEQRGDMFKEYVNKL